MSDLKDLYQELILDHNKNPKNFGHLDKPKNISEGYNPLCGDHYFIELNIQKNLIFDIRFNGSGCALSKASASLMTEAVKGQNMTYIKNLISDMQSLITGEREEIDNTKLKVFKNIQNYPIRAKCVSLAWHTLKSALNNNKIASTE